MTIGGRSRMGGGDVIDVVQPHNHRHVLGRLGNATDEDVAAAIGAARDAAPGWRALSFDDRAAVFLRAAELLAGPWRPTLNAATMLGQSKSPYQAEIDAACELIDFLRFNAGDARRILAEQPRSAPGAWNRMEYRPLEGFVLAITPFNFTSIAANLPAAPALMGNVVVWKPSPTQRLAAHYTMRLLEAAGLPPGVINFVPGPGRRCPGLRCRTPTSPACTSPARPRRSSTCGGRSARTSPATAATRGSSARPAARTSCSRTRRRTRRAGRPLVRGAFEYQGQKCSAVVARVRAPVAVGKAPARHHRPVESKMGDVGRLRGSWGRAIDARALARYAAASRGGLRPAVRGWRRPDRQARGLVRAGRPCSRRPNRGQGDQTEYFAPLLALHPYPDKDEAGTPARRPASPYALTGAVLAQTGPRSQAAERLGTPRGTSTSTTSPPAPWSASSPSAAPGRAAPTTRPGRCSTWSGGSALGPSRRRSCRRPTTVIRTWADAGEASMQVTG